LFGLEVEEINFIEKALASCACPDIFAQGITNGRT